MTITAFDHPVLSALVGDDEVERFLGFDAELAAMLTFERALAKVEAAHGVIPEDAAAAVATACQCYKPDMAALLAGAARDGMMVPELVAQLRASLPGEHSVNLHFGATSQDVIDTALVLRLKPVLALFDLRIAGLESALSGLSAGFGQNALTAYTRMQPAIDVSVADRIESWRAPLVRHRSRLAALAPALLAVQFGGAAGTLEKLGDKAGQVRAGLASELALAEAPQWHSQRDRLTELAGWLSLVTGTLGKLGLDIALMAQAGGEIEIGGGGTSSAMPHKRNPVSAELLVALARFNAAQLSALHQGLVHEQERSGAAWTLEWMTLPQMLAATGAATRHAGSVLSTITFLGRR